MSVDPVRLARTIVERVKATLSPLEERLFLVEARTPLVGEKGDTGEPGARGADGKDGRDGIDGKDGKDADLGLIAALRSEIDALRTELKAMRETKDAAPEVIRAAVAEAVALIPVPKDGRDGKDGRTITPEDVAGLIAVEVNRSIALIPKAIDGRDGISIASAHIDAEGQLVLGFSDGTHRSLGIVKGQDGRDGQPGVPGRWGEKGADGLDGLGFDDFDVQHDGERGFTFVISRGERKKTFGPFSVPMPIYRGVFEDGKTYHAQDEVTFGGHVWLAKMTTTAKPDEHTPDGKRAWLLVVRRGRDGKAGPEGKPGPQGPRGQG
jgi:hypothetical protein